MRGITVIEIMIVIGIFALLSGMTAILSLSSYRNSLARNDSALLISILQHARAQTINSICLGASCVGARSHGVFIDTNRYVLFQGDSYATRDIDQDIYLDKSSMVSNDGDSQVVFITPYATVARNSSFMLTTPSSSSTIVVSSAGLISRH